MVRAACTIVSLNYLPYARTLCDSFLELHPGCKFHVLLVDRVPKDLDLSQEKFELTVVEDLGIPDFETVAFKFGVLELNTNVKPTFMMRLLDGGIDQLIYFDPDILLCAPADPVYDELSAHAIVITPHCTSPNKDVPYDELLLLLNGVFNLGFVAVSNTPEARTFLTWWEERCLSLGYSERWSGLFVDQKWINFVPCYFESVKILKHPGCNMAYWNLHERVLSGPRESLIVNGSVPLIFYHFSGISIDGGSRISKHTEQFDLTSRPDLAPLFADYRERLASNGIREFRARKYAFGQFRNGTPINKLQRAAFAANLDRFGGSGPFDSEGPFFRWAKQRRLQSKSDTVGEFGRKAYRADDRRVRIVNGLFRWALRILGADRYTVLMKYLEFASVLRNQRDIFESPAKVRAGQGIDSRS
jgi:hypothetical protein